MQLNDLLQEHSLKSISQRTNISEENLEALLDENYASLTRVKTLGFYSILEREYGIDVTELKKKAKAYYKENRLDEESVIIESTLPEHEKSGKGWIGWSIVAIIVAAVVGWYLFGSPDLNRIKEKLPFFSAAYSQKTAQQNKKVPESTLTEKVDGVTETEE